MQIKKTTGPDEGDFKMNKIIGKVSSCKCQWKNGEAIGGIIHET